MTWSSHTDPDFDAVDPPGPFTEWERAAIDRLLALNHPWSAVARDQLRAARVSARCRHCPSIDIVVPDNTLRLPPTDIEVPPFALHGKDVDGMFVEITLIPHGDAIGAMDVWRGDLESFGPPPIEAFGPATYG